MASSKFSWNTTTLNAIQKQMSDGLLSLGNAIADREKELAPFEEGTLVNSIGAREDGKNKVIIKAGGGKVPYAYRRNFENQLHPSTKHYAENALESVVRGGVAQYFKIGDKA